MTTQSSTLAWRIPWAEEPGGLQFKESQKVGHNLVTKQQETRRSDSDATGPWTTLSGERVWTVHTALDAPPLPQTAGKATRALTQPLWWKEAHPPMGQVSLREGSGQAESRVPDSAGWTLESGAQGRPVPLPTSFDVKRARGGSARRPLCLQSGYR